ncbi:UTP:RNA uridylyltransferase 1 [Halotydeus destructor]|nr:UTP:RNA uridylyltransferase 1 [Halotydeus destructor]
MATMRSFSDVEIGARSRPLVQLAKRPVAAIDMNDGVPSRFQLQTPSKKKRRFRKKLISFGSSGSSFDSSDTNLHIKGHILVKGFPVDTDTMKIRDVFYEYDVRGVELGLTKLVAMVKFGRQGIKDFRRLSNQVVSTKDGEFQLECSEVFLRKTEYELFEAETINYVEVIKSMMELSNFEEQVDILREKVLMNKSDIEKRIQVVEFLEKHFEFGCIVGKLYFLGSTANGIGFKDADLDLFLHMLNFLDSDIVMDWDLAVDHLENVHPCLKKICRMHIIRPIAARAPILKLNFSHKHGVAVGLNVDICVRSFLGVHNSKLIRFFCDKQPVFRDLAMIIKFWAKKFMIIGPTLMTSYSLVVLVMFYLQVNKVLPSIESLQADSKPEIISDEDNDGKDIDYRVDFSTEQFKCQADLKLSDLLIGFFKYYAKLNYADNVISPYHGRLVPRRELVQSQPRFYAKSEVAIQDFFELDRNLTDRPAICRMFGHKVQQVYDDILMMGEGVVALNPASLVKSLFRTSDYLKLYNGVAGNEHRPRLAQSRRRLVTKRHDDEDVELITIE